MNKLALAAFLLMILSGCVSAPEDQDLQNRMAVAAKSLGNNFKFFYVPSDGVIANSTFIAMSKSSGPSSTARQLASAISEGANSSYRLAVSGPSSAKTFQVIKDAFGLLNGRKLTHLEFMYVGGVSDRDEIKSIVESAGGTFVFAPY